MKKQILPIMFERIPDEVFNYQLLQPRYRAISRLCAKYNMIPQFVDGRQQEELLLVWPNTTEWFERVCEVYKKSRLIIKGNPDICSAYSFISAVSENIVMETHRILSYFRAAGKRNIALFAPTRKGLECMFYANTFLRAGLSHGLVIPESSVFWNDDDGLPAVFQEFLQVYKQFDAVLCYNTQSAIYFCMKAKEAGIRVPEDLFVVGRGNLTLSTAVCPSITTVSLDENEVGTQLVKMYRYLYKNPCVESTTALLRSYIIPRESTANFPDPINENTFIVNETPSVFDRTLTGEPTYMEIEQILRAFNSCNDLDIRLLKGMQAGISREKLAEQNFVTLETVRYRLRRILKISNTENRQDLFALMDKYNINLDIYSKHNNI